MTVYAGQTAWGMYFHIFQCQTLHLYVVDCEDYYIPYGGSD